MRLALSFLGPVLISMIAASCSGTDSPSTGETGGSAVGGADVAGGGDAGGDMAAPAAGAASTAGDGSAGATGGSGNESTGGVLGGDAGSPGLGSAGAPGACQAVEASQELAAGIHVDACSPIDYATNPPSSGEHYPSWADFGVYDFALPRGYWVHNLEHGAVVVTYNCPDGCDADVAAATAWLEQLAPDAGCPAGPARVLLVPDPLLDTRWAASSWGFTLRADCFDADVFSNFYAHHVGQPSAPEGSLCGTGVDFRADDAETCGATAP